RKYERGAEDEILKYSVHCCHGLFPAVGVRRNHTRDRADRWQHPPGGGRVDEPGDIPAALGYPGRDRGSSTADQSHPFSSGGNYGTEDGGEARERVAYPW